MDTSADMCPECGKGRWYTADVKQCVDCGYAEPISTEDYKGLIYPLPPEISEQEKEQYRWGSNAAYEFAAKLRQKKEE